MFNFILRQNVPSFYKYEMRFWINVLFDYQIKYFFIYTVSKTYNIYPIPLLGKL